MSFYDDLLAQEQELRFAAFTHDDAWTLGSGIRAAAHDGSLPVAIAVWFGPQRVFHAALPGANADNDAWLERKYRVVQRYGRASMAVGEMFRESGKNFDVDSRLDPTEFAAHGGVVPISIRNAGIIGAVGVSGLPQRDDHALVVEHLRRLLARTGG
ncbi:heme-degrading domain-containing protein [Orlajensenia leifsoniae]|uniref:UPF0303 protein E4M00_10455 n=1 Tax=Orlajensenia leifsoniae TaxID=2561933 RepID=A0A4Y9R4D9_9MICO|nr:heme-degrading domain-containing protein [Leifsonia flava]TFV98406.1 heme-degrading domain-containing protein [Leifsonia flava]